MSGDISISKPKSLKIGKKPKSLKIGENPKSELELLGKLDKKPKSLKLGKKPKLELESVETLETKPEKMSEYKQLEYDLFGTDSDISPEIEEFEMETVFSKENDSADIEDMPDLDDDIEVFLNHIKLLSGSENTEEVSEYLIKYFAHIINFQAFCQAQALF